MSRTKTAMLIVGACLMALSTYASASIIVQLTSITADNNGLSLVVFGDYQRGRGRRLLHHL